MTWKALLPYGIIAALLIALVLTCGDESPEPILSDETNAEIERLRADSAEYAKSQDSLRQLAQAAHDVSVQREAAARRAHLHATQHAEEAERMRIQLASATDARDSLPIVMQVLDARTREAEALSVAFDSLDAALILARRAEANANERADRAEERLHAIEQLNARILDDVREAEKGCRILGIVRCPTRKEAFIVGTIIGAGGALGVTLAAR